MLIGSLHTPPQHTTHERWRQYAKSAWWYNWDRRTIHIHVMYRYKEEKKILKLTGANDINKIGPFFLLRKSTQVIFSLGIIHSNWNFKFISTMKKEEEIWQNKIVFIGTRAKILWIYVISWPPLSPATTTKNLDSSYIAKYHHHVSNETLWKSAMSHQFFISLNYFYRFY